MGITSGEILFNEGRDVISRADVGCLTAPMCVTSDNTKVHDIIKTTTTTAYHILVEEISN